MAYEPRQGNQYGNAKIGGRASLLQGDDNRNIGHLIQIENAYFASLDGPDFPNELLARANAKQQKHDHLGGTRNPFLLEGGDPPLKQSGASQRRDGSSPKTLKRFAFSDYTVGWICALPLELAASRLLLDEQHEPPATPLRDNSTRYFGRIGRHNVVLACSPISKTGTNSAATCRDILRTFPIDLILFVGVAGGIPSEWFDVRFGDVVVARPQLEHGGVVQYDFGKFLEDGTFKMTRCLTRPNSRVLNVLTTMAALEESGDIDLARHVEKVSRKVPKFAKPDLALHPDLLFESGTPHVDSQAAGRPLLSTCSFCDQRRIKSRTVRSGDEIKIHHGTVLSGNTQMRNAVERDRCSKQFPDAACFEMESSGLYEEAFCIVIRGICDYSDEHKEESWQRYAALTAAAYAKEVVLNMTPSPSSFDTVNRELITSVAEFESDQQRSWTTLLSIPSKILAVNEWFSARAAQPFGLIQDQVHSGRNRSDSSAAGSNPDERSTTIHASTSWNTNKEVPLSVALQLTSSSAQAQTEGLSNIVEDNAAFRDFLALQMQALVVLRNALQGYLSSSRAFSYVSSWMNAIRNVPLSVSMVLADNIIFVDANDTQHTLPLEYFRGWDTFQSMIQDRFRTHPGYHKIKAQQYSISIAGRPELTLDRRLWRELKPRMKITMDIVFENLFLDGGACCLCNQTLHFDGTSLWRCRHCAVSFSTMQIARHDADALILQTFREIPGSSSQSLAVDQHDLASPSLADTRYHLAYRFEGPDDLIPSGFPHGSRTNPSNYPRPRGIAEDAAQVNDEEDALPEREQALKNVAVEDEASFSKSGVTKKRTLETEEDKSTLPLFKRARISPKSMIYGALWSHDQSAIMNTIVSTSDIDGQLLDRKLMAAVLSGNVHLVRSLLARGANPLCSIDPLGTSLRMATLLKYDSMLHDLLLQAARGSKHNDLEAELFRQGMLETLITATQYNCQTSAKILLSFGANPFEILAHRSSPLLHAVRLFNMNLFKLFLTRARTLDLLSEHEHDLLTSYAEKRLSQNSAFALPRDQVVEQYRLGLLRDLVDKDLALCISETIQGRGRILQSWISARLKEKGPYEKLPGTSEYNAFFTTGLEDGEVLENIPESLPQIVISPSFF